MIEFAPSEITGELVELMEAVVVPENPDRLAVLKVPLIVAIPEVPKVMTLVPPFMVATAARVNVVELLKPIAKLFVLKSPLFTLKFPVTLDIVTAAPNVAPVLASVLLVVMFA